MQAIDLKEMDDRIQLLRKTAEELKQMGTDFPALDRNTARVLAAIRLLELNISDVIDL